MISISK